MPHKKRSHGHHHHHHKQTKEEKEEKEQNQKEVLAPKVDIQDRQCPKSPFYSAAPYYRKSQPGQATPKPAAQVSTVKPAQFETSSSGSAMATKPGEVTTATGGAAGRGVTVGGSATAGMAGTPETAPMSQVSAPTTVPSALSGTSGRTTAAGTTVAQTKEPTNLSAQSLLAGTTFKPDLNKAKTTLTSASVLEKKDQATPTQKKVQVEVPSAAAGVKKAPDADPFDALASILPSADTVVRPVPVYTGPEVTESGVTSTEGVRCGEREDTLPPGYRLGDMGPPPANWKPQDVPKPLSTDEALDSLSAGFMMSTAPSGPPQPKDDVCTVSTGPTNFTKPPADKKPKMEKGTGSLAGITATPFKKTPPTEKKLKGPSTSLDAIGALGDLLPTDAPKPEAPKLRPEDIVSEGKHKEEEAVLVGERDDTIHPDYRFKKVDLEKFPAPKPERTMDTGEALDFLSGGFTASSAAPTVCSPAPPAQKVQTSAAAPLVADDFSLEAGLTSTTAKKVESSALPPAPTTAGGKTKGGSMSRGALSALGDLLPSDVPKPKEPEVRPEDIVSEAKHKEEDAVLVGEREDSIHPDYRFTVEDLKNLPAPKPEPTMATGDALDILSGDFVTTDSAPVVSAKVSVEKMSALDVLSGDFVAPSKASQAQASLPPPATKTPEGDGLSLDVLSALSNTLPADVPKPESPKLRPEDIVSEKKHKEEDAVLVGERDDTIHPDYRFKKEDLEKLPAPKPELTLDTDEALDMLSGDFMTSKAAPAVQAAVSCSTAPPTQSSADFALDTLARDFVTPTAAAKVESASSFAADADLELAAGADGALDALSDTLQDIKPIPQPEPALPKNIVDEKKAVEERLIKMGERDDTLPPEYRPTEEDLKKMAEAAEKEAAKPKPTLDDKTALDLLSMDFSAAPKPPASTTSCAVTTKLEPPALDSDPLKPMPGPVLKTLSSTLLPDAPEFKPKTDKPKGKSKSKSKSKKHAEEPSATDLPAQPSTDVVSTSTKKGGKR